MRTLRIVLLGLMLSAGLVSGADAHGPRVGFSVNLGYPPVYVAPPVYYTPPPPIYYAPPPRIYYAPPPPVIYGPPYGYAGYSYGYNYGSHRGWDKHHRHHQHRRH